MDEPTSADVDALAAYVEAAAPARNELAGRGEALRDLVNRVLAASPGRGIDGTHRLVERVEALAVQWLASESLADGVRTALLGAGGSGPLRSAPDWMVQAALEGRAASLVDAIQADLVGGGLDGDSAKAIASEATTLIEQDPHLTLFAALTRAAAAHLGISEDEMERRWRAFGLSRAEVAQGLAAAYADLAARSGGHGIDRAGLQVSLGDPTVSDATRDLAYRLLHDVNLFNDLDVTARTRDVTPVGFDHSQTDGIIGQSDVDQFATKDGLITGLLPWRLLLDTAADGFDLSVADGRIRSRDLDAFLRNGDVPPEVRQAAWQFYSTWNEDVSHGVKPFEPSAADRQTPGYQEALARGFVLAPTAGGAGRLGVLGDLSPIRTELPEPGADTAAEGTGNGAAALAAAVMFAAVDPAIDWTTHQIQQWLAPGAPPTFRVIDPVTGQPTDIATSGLAAFPARQRAQAIRWLAVTGRLPTADELSLDPLAAPRPSRPNGSFFAADRFLAPRATTEVNPADPRQYRGADGNWYWFDTNRSVATSPNRSMSRADDGIWYWDDTGKPVFQVGTRPDPAAESDKDKQVAIELQNASADYWRSQGAEVIYISDGNKGVAPLDRDGKPPPNPTKRPDHLVDGTFRDVYAPRGDNATSAVQDAAGKVQNGQAQRVDIVLRKDRTTLTVRDIRTAFAAIVTPNLRFFRYRRQGTDFPVLEITVLDVSTGEFEVIYKAEGP